MKYFIDTHVMIWALSEPEKLSKKVIEIIQNPACQILVSAVSFWEISIKYRLGKLDISPKQPNELPLGCQQIGFIILPMDAQTASSYHLLKSEHHRDPFDRMIIWQALDMNIPLITKDETIKKYQSEGLKVVW